jgi:DNA-binding PadR family transcriptional regulator
MSVPDSGGQIVAVARLQWTTICREASTPAQHASILDARQRFRRIDPAPYEMMVTAYQKLVRDGVYRPINDLALSAIELTDLAVIVSGATAGVACRFLDKAARNNLARMRLIQFRGPDRQPAHGDSTGARAVATLAGVAISRACEDKPVMLSAAEAIALAKLDADGGADLWPGSMQTRRVAQHWGLVDRVQGRYRLTTEGRAALMRARDQVGEDPKIPSRLQGELLAWALEQGREEMTLYDSFNMSLVDGCVSRMWVERIGKKPVGMTRRTLFRVTASGREALERFKAEREILITRPTRVTSPQLINGEWFRMHNRADRGIGDGWVQLHKRERATASNGNAGFKLMVREAEDGPVVVYGDRVFYASTKFEVRAGQTLHMS